MFRPGAPVGFPLGNGFHTAVQLRPPVTDIPGKLNRAGFEDAVGDRHVLVVEDIVDSGTVWLFRDYLKMKKTGLTAVFAVYWINRPGARRRCPCIYAVLTVPDKFRRGYGMDTRSNTVIYRIFACSANSFQRSAFSYQLPAIRKIIPMIYLNRSGG